MWRWKRNPSNKMSGTVSGMLVTFVKLSRYCPRLSQTIPNCPRLIIHLGTMWIRNWDDLAWSQTMWAHIIIIPAIPDKNLNVTLGWRPFFGLFSWTFSIHYNRVYCDSTQRYFQTYMDVTSHCLLNRMWKNVIHCLILYTNIHQSYTPTVGRLMNGSLPSKQCLWKPINHK